MNKNRFPKIVVLVAIFSILLFLVACTDINIEECMPSVLEIFIFDKEGVAINKGTGFCVKDENTILSVAHLFEQYNEIGDCIKGYSINGEEFTLALIDVNHDKDLAILEIINNKMKPLILSDSPSKNLDEVFIIGNTKGYGLSYNKGIISMAKKTLNINGLSKTVVQTNITINHGDSGAPVINKNNQIVGMMSFKLTDGNGQSVDGISFSILLEDIKAFIKQH